MRVMRRFLNRVRKALPYLLSERAEAFQNHLDERAAYDSQLLHMGRASYGRPRVVTDPNHTRVRVGAFVSIGVDVVLLDGGHHRTDWVTTFPLRAALNLPGKYQDGHPTTSGDIAIGNDVWIGRGARILSGVTIGDGAVIGGYSVVAKDVRPYAIVVGNPAREVRRRFSDDQIEALLAIAWWEWPMTKILECVPELSDPNINRFITRHLPQAPPAATSRPGHEARETTQPNQGGGRGGTGGMGRDALPAPPRQGPGVTR
jgi:acetyltransferase-like isoleucine patch superfamily enzyme